MRVRKILLALTGVVLLLGTGLTGTSGAASTVTVSPNFASEPAQALWALTLSTAP